MGSYGDALRAKMRGDTAAAEEEDDKGGIFGFKMPKFGLGELVNDVVGIVPGLARLGSSLAPGGQAAGETWSRFGKGIASSGLGTLATVGKSVGVGDRPIEWAGEKLLGEEYRPRDIFERAEDRGWLPALAEDIGNIALGAGAATKLARVSSVGKLAAAESAATRAAKLGISEAEIARAADIASSAKGFGKYRKAGVKGVTKEAGKALSKAEGVTADAGAVVSRTKLINALDVAAHPYTSSFTGVLRPIGKAGVAKQIGELGEGRIRDVGQSETVRVPTTDKPALPFEHRVGKGPLYHVTRRRDEILGRGSFVPSRMGESGPGVYLTPDAAHAERMLGYGDDMRAIEVTTPEGLRLLDRSTPEGEAEFRRIQLTVEPSIYRNPEGFQQALADAGYDGVYRAGDPAKGVDPELVIHNPEGLGMRGVDTVRQGYEPGTAAQGSLPVSTGRPVEPGFAAPALVGPDGMPLRLPNDPAVFEPGVIKQRLQGDVRMDEGLVDPRITPDMGPYEQRTRIQAAQAAPDWATRLVERLPDTGQRLAAKIGRSDLGLQERGVIKERGRMQDASNRRVWRAPAVVKTTTAARKHLVGKELPDGTAITREMADQLVGDEVMASLTIVDTIEDAIRRANDPEAAAAMDEVLQGELHARSAQRIPQEWLYDEVTGELNELGQALEGAKAAFRDEFATQRLEALKAGRKGDEGLEFINEDTPGMSRRSEKDLKRAQADLAEAKRLRTKVAPKQRKVVERKIKDLRLEVEQLKAKIDNENRRAQQASEQFTQSRLPKGRQVGDVMKAAGPQSPSGGGPYSVEGSRTGLSPGDEAALGLTMTPEGIPVVQSPAQRARSLPDVSGAETRTSTYRRGVAGGRAMEGIQRAADRAVEHGQRVQKLEGELDDMRRILTGEDFEANRQAARLEARAERTLGKIEERLEDPNVVDVPQHWAPAWKTLKALHAEAKNNPALAEALEGLPERFSTIVRLAQEKGFDPTHVRSFSDAEVRKFVYEATKLGFDGRDIGQAGGAGTRKTRRNPMPRTRSLSALGAAIGEATHEMHSNAVADVTEELFARDVPPGYREGTGQLPKGWVPWDAERSYLLRGRRMKASEGGGLEVEGTGRATKMIPEEVSKVLKAYGADYNHGLWRYIKKVTDPWRLLVLTLSPRWYANNFVSNVILTSKEGVRPQDWSRAWRSFRKGGADPTRNKFLQRFGAGTESFTGPESGAIAPNIFNETGAEGSVIPPRAGLKGMRKNASEIREFQGIQGVLDEATRPIRRANEVVDELARVATYFSSKRKGLSDAAALERATKALVDYNDLSPFERQAVRSVVPFYSWQKGILKLAAKAMADHPFAVSAALQVYQLNQDLMEDQYGAALPRAYESVVDLGPLGKRNLRSFNPFVDAGSLTSPQGIAASMNPFVESATRNALGAPEGGFADYWRENEFGSLVPDTSPAQDFTEAFEFLPQARVGQAIASGQDVSGRGRSAALQGYLGAPTYTDEQVQAIIDRVLKTQERL